RALARVCDARTPGRHQNAPRREEPKDGVGARANAWGRARSRRLALSAQLSARRDPREELIARAHQEAHRAPDLVAALGVRGALAAVGSASGRGAPRLVEAAPHVVEQSLHAR